MFEMLFNVEKDGNIILQDKSITLMPSMFEVYKHKRMGSDMVRWVIMIYDYKSPYRNLPTDERIKKVTYELFGKLTHSYCTDPLVEKAVSEYQKLQYDPLIEQYMAMKDKMFEKTKIYKEHQVSAKNISELNKLEVEFEESATSMEKIRMLIIKSQESSVKISGTAIEDLSLLEQDHMRENDK